MRDVEEVNARALASLADAPQRTARRRPRRARRVMRASWFVACVVALSAASRGAGAACAVESDGVRWCQVASSSTPSGLNITYAHAPGAATLDVRVRATFSGAHDPGSAGWIALGPGSGMMSGEVVVASGGAGSAATYYQLTGQSKPSTLCGGGVCAERGERDGGDGVEDGRGAVSRRERERGGRRSPSCTRRRRARGRRNTRRLGAED